MNFEYPQKESNPQYWSRNPAVFPLAYEDLVRVVGIGPTLAD